MSTIIIKCKPRVMSYKAAFSGILMWRWKCTCGDESWGWNSWEPCFKFAYSHKESGASERVYANSRRQ